MECLDGDMPEVGQATTPSVDRCPLRVSGRPGTNTLRRAGGGATPKPASRRSDALPELFLGYLDEVGRETLDETEARDLAGFWVRRHRRRYAPKRPACCVQGLPVVETECLFVDVAEQVERFDRNVGAAQSA